MKIYNIITFRPDDQNYLANMAFKSIQGSKIRIFNNLTP